jgi:hypothetical protein
VCHSVVSRLEQLFHDGPLGGGEMLPQYPSSLIGASLALTHLGVSRATETNAKLSA